MIDDPNSPIRRFPNSRFSKLSPDKYKYYPQAEVYARSTCLHNNILNIDETTNGLIAEGSGGVARRGTFVVPSTGVRIDGVVKLVLKEKMSSEDLNEVKSALEVQRVVPDYVIQTYILERCDILNSSNRPDKVNAIKDLLLIGMERGINSVAGQLNKQAGDIHLKQLIKQSLKACYEFNCAGFFHRDIKPENMVVVERQGRQRAVLIDFGETVYMSQVLDYSTGRYNQYTSNPPFDTMYLGLFFLKEVGKKSSPQVRNYILKKLQRYYEILMRLEPRFVNINSRFFDHYRLHEPFATFQKLQRYPGDEITNNYFIKHNDRVHFYRTKFNDSIIRGFTNNEAGFRLLKNTFNASTNELLIGSSNEEMRKKQQLDLEKRIIINRQKRKEEERVFLQKKLEEERVFLQKKQQLDLEIRKQEDQERIILQKTQEKEKRRVQNLKEEENINFLQKKAEYLKRRFPWKQENKHLERSPERSPQKVYLPKTPERSPQNVYLPTNPERSPERSPKVYLQERSVRSPSWRNYKTRSPSPVVHQSKHEKVHPIFRKSPLGLKSPKKPKPKKRYLTPRKSASPPPSKRLRQNY